MIVRQPNQHVTFRPQPIELALGVLAGGAPELGVTVPAEMADAGRDRRPQQDVGNAEIRRVLSLPDVKEKLTAQGAEAMGNTSEQFAEQIRRDLARWTKVAKEANVRID